MQLGMEIEPICKIVASFSVMVYLIDTKRGEHNELFTE